MLWLSSRNSISFARMWNSRLPSLAALLLFVFAGCADDLSAEATQEASLDAWTQIRVHRDMDAPAARAWSAEAWFAEFSGVDARTVREAMDMVDAAGEGCVIVPRHQQHSGQSSIRFKAMGAARLRDDAGTEHTMQPRSLAMQTDSIHGVVYSTNADDHDQSAWQVDLINADGSTRLELHQDAPTGWGIVAINGDTTYSDPYHLTDDALDLTIDYHADVAILTAHRVGEDAQEQLVCALEGENFTLARTALDELRGSGAIQVQLTLRNHRDLLHGNTLAGDASIELHDHLHVEIDASSD